MVATIITTEELHEFKLELLDEIKILLKNNVQHQPKKWMKSAEVRKFLGISPGTLQNFRINGTIPFTRLGGVLYYDYEDISKTLEKNRSNNS
ncbi:helix-turn-helix domain-containing protein [Aureibaculum sp. 2210JD6-5]|uniref:helix-turn-helix domain-containing protein n=1 Tax=Aureibaculum sp. 2210JD6-5 TaxID=3103957 RepID=UPI002AADFE9D|nr:helix-turn-helix domain-containing protein [Aureibaculum sp. 2210JD6-5]MDY7396327.1 helix-turn-helix domain-containing protein [Aureibaculum sp. 2210JD6-5]